jgi:uncharacterized zinc-type alcohol dehydrogenase-like protein
MATNIGYAEPDAIAPLAPLSFDRPLASRQDVRIGISSAGVCHSDIDQPRNEFGGLSEEGTA